MPQGRTPIVWNMTVRDALLNVINEDMEELFSRVEALELGKLAGLVLATEEEAIAGVDNTKAMTPLRTHQAIDAATSGYLANYYRNDEDIYVSQGKVVGFADEAGDKVRLYGTQYGIAINPYELTLYTPSDSEVSVRSGGYAGPKLGDVIHTGNVDDKGVDRKISLVVSTAGNNYTVKAFRCDFDISTNYTSVGTVYIPWTGTTRYSFKFNNYSSSNAVNVYVKIKTTEYGPYAINANNDISVDIDDSQTGERVIWLRASSTYSDCTSIKVKTGNPDILRGFVVIWAASTVYPL